MAGDYEIIPTEEVSKLKSEIERLKLEQTDAPTTIIANTLDRLANTLEKLFKIFEVAATEIENEQLHQKSFDEKISPIMHRLSEIERQNKDIAEGILALADIVKKKVREPEQQPQRQSQRSEFPPLEPMRVNPSPRMEFAPEVKPISPPPSAPSGLPPIGPPPAPSRSNSPPPFPGGMPPPPPPPAKGGVADRFR